MAEVAASRHAGNAEGENDDGYDDDGAWDEDDWEEDEDWGDEDDDWEEDDEDEEEDEGLVLQRVAQGGPNRQRSVGLHTIEIYYPQFYFKQIEMEEWDSQPTRYGPAVIGKYTKGIGQVEARFPTDDEDPVSFAMTVTHRVIERMDKDGFNETARYNPEGTTLNPWHAFGRIDIGSESLIDRSKSMKAYLMDLFERYGDGEANIEGVDMYNACYGGQAAGLCCLSWVESDRWDGRYGMSIATDISDAHSSHLFTVGAACTGTLFFPDAPAAHHSLRASAILHRFDFFKPVGWRSMGPVVDGKYSIDAYMTCIDLCYEVLKKKMNNRPLFQTTHYNVFHTGGGFHICKKSFERMCRADDADSTHDKRAQLLQSRLMPSVHLLKIIGPCHTVSSFLNISSVIMSEWEKQLGKVLMVFTYGSGCASSLYQVRFDDIAWFVPLAQWKANFYSRAIYQHPSTMIHEVYVMTWMKFDYRPIGRKTFNVDPFSLQKNVYYLMEIDKWGRRFYHRGGVAAPALKDEFKLRVDAAEGRPKRSAYDPVPEKQLQVEKTLEEEWKQIEYEMTFDENFQPEEEIVQDAFMKGKESCKILVVNQKQHWTPQGMSIEHDGQQHSYFIIGSWSRWSEMEEMEEEEEGRFQFTVTLGENSWEEFVLIQDRDPNKKIFPAQKKSWKSRPCIGPHYGGDGQRWRIDARDLDETPEEDLGRPGDQYLVEFVWRPGGVKNLEWDKLEGERGDYPMGTYFAKGSWTCWDPVELENKGNGLFRLETSLTWLGIEFHIQRNADPTQVVCPDVSKRTEVGSSGAALLGPDDIEQPSMWRVDGSLGDKFEIDFYRDPSEPSHMSLTWAKVGSGPELQPTSRYFIVAPGNGWGSFGFWEMRQLAPSAYVFELEMKSPVEVFRIVLFKRTDLSIHPDKKDGVSQQQAHKVLGPDANYEERFWAIGKASADRAKVGDVFSIAYDAEGQKVTWKKR